MRIKGVLSLDLADTTLHSMTEDATWQQEEAWLVLVAASARGLDPGRRTATALPSHATHVTLARVEAGEVYCQTGVSGTVTMA